jgi:nitric oxide reductase NorD protein
MVEDTHGLTGLEWFRLMALQQATRAVRGSPAAWSALEDPAQQALFLLYEANCADAQLVQLLPGLVPALARLRREALVTRPPVAELPMHRQPLERVARSVLETGIQELQVWPMERAVERARHDAKGMPAGAKGRMLFRDRWTGEFRKPQPASLIQHVKPDSAPSDNQVMRSARLPRSPTVREAPEDEQDAKPGAWMVQTAKPHEQVEDPIGLERPTDRDESTAAEDLADSLSELPQARLVATPGSAKEVLLSEQPPDARARQSLRQRLDLQGEVLKYPEWDYRSRSYIDGGVVVHVHAAAEGAQHWVDRTLDTHRAMLNLVRRRFEMLKARRVRLRKQIEGDDVDVDACIDAYCDARAGLPMPQSLYQTYRAQRRDTAVLILQDISASTDAWVSANKRVVDVEREALLLVTMALQGLAEPFALQAFSGRGPGGVFIRDIKRFADPCSDVVARRIASLEPEQYTRAGAAIRHATATLMREQARHRLLLLLFDGKPNDIDDYEGRYGVEDMRQTVIEARLQGINTFCLTVDRQAPGYLPDIFGIHRYALLPRPDLLPTVLLEWMRRLIVS